MTTKKEARAAEIEANKFNAWIKKVRTSLGFIFDRMNFDAARRAYDAGTSADAYAAEIASTHPVGFALHPRKADAIAFADAEANAKAERLLAILAEHGMDLEIAAPYPSSRLGRDAYRQALAKRQAFEAITKAAPTTLSRRPGSPDIRIRCEQNIQRFINNARIATAFEYDMFICKMTTKVGPVVWASIEGNHVWGYSHLTVTKADGSKEIWKTQQIINHSVYGLAYLQWPSRKVK